MKNAFYFMLKALFVLEIFTVTYLLDIYIYFLVCRKMAWKESYGWFQNLWRHKLDNKSIKIRILSNISRSKGNQTKKFGQFIEYIEYNMWNIFVCGGEASPRAFYKKIKIEYISKSTVWNVIRFAFIVYPS